MRVKDCEDCRLKVIVMLVKSSVTVARYLSQLQSLFMSIWFSPGAHSFLLPVFDSKQKVYSKYPNC